MVLLPYLSEAAARKLLEASGLCCVLMFAGDCTSQSIETCAARRRLEENQQRAEAAMRRNPHAPEPDQDHADEDKHAPDIDGTAYRDVKNVGVTLLLSVSGGYKAPDPLLSVAGYPELARGWDTLRTTRCAAIGALWRAPNQVAWYAIVQSTMPGSGLGHSVWVTFIDQVTFTPWMDVSFLAGESVLKNGGCQRVCPDLQDKFLPVLITNWQVWPALNIVMYTLVPPEYWILYNGLCNYCWNVYLTWKAAQLIDDDDGKDDDEEEGSTDDPHQ